MSGNIHIKGNCLRGQIKTYFQLTNFVISKFNKSSKLYETSFYQTNG